jgi:cbb3-type cytochrome oxidase maturation protein
MEILYLLVPLSVVLVFLVGVVFWYALASGQFDDLEGPAHRILMDDDTPAAPLSEEPCTAERGASPDAQS